MDLTVEEFKSKQRDEVRDLLLDTSRKSQQKAHDALGDMTRRVDKLFASATDPNDTVEAVAGANGSVQTLSQLLHEKLAYELPPEEMAGLNHEQLNRRVISAVEHRYCPEIRSMERQLVLQVLDTAWKDHLLAMDYLRSSVGLRGYAQVDPKVEYKRVGMQTFEEMWHNIGEQVTDLIFRMERLDDGFVGSTWQNAEAHHDEAPAASDMAQQQQSAIESSGRGESKPEPIRNRIERVGRNDPCPCGSGKKFKQCCMKKGGVTV